MATQENLDRVQQLYVAYYGRPADSEGQEYWADRLEAEGEGAIINAFGNSEEYEAKAEGEGNATLVNSIYLQAFGRNADPEGLTYYTTVLANEEKSLAEIATTIINAAQGIDQQTFNAKVSAAADYTAEFGAAEDYDLEAAQAVVADTDGGLYTPELTEALETLQATQEAKEDFLAPLDLDEGEVNQNLADAETALADDVTANGSINALNADLLDAEEAVAAAEGDISEVAGLRKEISDYQAAQEALKEANAAAVDAWAEVVGEVAAFESRNGGTLTVNDDGTVSHSGGADVIILNDDDELEIDQEFDGAEALLADIQANLAAEEALSDAQDAEAEALAAVEETEDAGGNTPLFDALVSAEAEVTAAEKALETRAELEEDVADTQALVDELDALNDAIAEAEAAITDTEEDGGLELNLVDGYGVATVNSDVYLFEESDVVETVANFGDEGEDHIFFGEGFALVELSEDDGAEFVAGDFSADVGTESDLEIFWAEDSSDLNLFVENKAFAGNSTSGDDFTQITLTGVTAEDITFEGGYLSAGEVA